jgi:CO/xanthine dehydrogenase FAD-binding subunit
VTAYLRPHGLAEALAARAAHPDYLVLAGGTDAMVGAADRAPPPGVIDLFGLGELCGVRRDGGGAVRIGAATTYAQLLASPVVRDELPALWAAAREVGAVQIQARGTLGGNAATSSPVGDTLPVLLALDAAIELTAASGERVLPYAEFLTGYRRTALAADELIAAFRFPPRAPGTRQFWRKVGTRRAQAISKVMIAAAGHVDAAGRIDHIRVALGAVADRPVRARGAEAALLGQVPGAEATAQARAALAGDITPIDDVRSTAQYRMTVAGNLVARFVALLAG